MSGRVKGVNPESLLPATANSPSNDGSNRLHLALEMLLGIALLSVALFWEKDTPLMRPLPYQYLQTTDEYLSDLTHDQIPNFRGAVSRPQLLLVSLLLPLVLQFAVLLVFQHHKQQLMLPHDDLFSELHVVVCTTCFAMAITVGATHALKNYVGYLRPILYAYCEPSDDYQVCTAENSTFIRQSFPSGHTSEATCGMTILSLFLHRRWRLFLTLRQNLHTRGSSLLWQDRLILLLGLFFVPLLTAGYIGCSRIFGNMHFPADVVGGAALGTTVAIFINSLWQQEPGSVIGDGNRHAPAELEMKQQTAL